MVGEADGTCVGTLVGAAVGILVGDAVGCSPRHMQRRVTEPAHETRLPVDVAEPRYPWRFVGPGVGPTPVPQLRQLTDSCDGVGAGRRPVDSEPDHHVSVGGSNVKGVGLGPKKHPTVPVGHALVYCVGTGEEGEYCTMAAVGDIPAKILAIVSEPLGLVEYVQLAKTVSVPSMHCGERVGLGQIVGVYHRR
jgi:hypothetical protein